MEITHRKLLAVRLSLERSSDERLSDPTIQQALVHNENLAFIQVLNSVLSASPAMMQELQRLKRVIDLLGI